jgi:hypothetical protein
MLMITGREARNFHTAAQTSSLAERGRNLASKSKRPTTLWDIGLLLIIYKKIN